MNAPFLESSEQLNILFPAYLHKIKFHIFQNISKCLIHRLIPFKHKNMCELCDIIPKKYKKGRIMLNKCSVIHKEVIDIFHEFFYIPTIEKLSFHLSHVSILGSMEYGKTRNDCFRANASKKYIKFKNDYVEKPAKRPVYKYRVNIGVEIENYQWKILLLNIFQLLLSMMA